MIKLSKHLIKSMLDRRYIIKNNKLKKFTTFKRPSANVSTGNVNWMRKIYLHFSPSLNLETRTLNAYHPAFTLRKRESTHYLNFRSLSQRTKGHCSRIYLFTFDAITISTQNGA